LLRAECLAIEYSTKPFFLFGVQVLYKPPALKGLYMDKKLFILIGLLAVGAAMIVAGLVIVFVGLP
jgi:hypothetical protein